MDSHPPEVVERTATVVFRGNAAGCSEYGLVLDAKGLAYRSVEADGACLLLVAPELAVAAGEELARYAAERFERQPPPPAVVPFTGASAAAGVYVTVLVAVSYFAGDHLFGADWLARGALDSGTGMAHEWWRGITALTLHLDQEHLLGNLLFGSAIGILAARMFGPGVAWLSILLCGTAANYADMLMSPPWHRAVGASTAVFAALGLLAGHGWGRRRPLRDRRLYRWGPLFGGICLLALLGAGNEHVDVLGHLLGFAAGTVLGFGYARAGMPLNRGKPLQFAAGFIAVALLLSAWLFALRPAA
jgi:membrane associated rhomboid family serine protease